ncbi:MAG: hypothetical protein J0H54_05260 [Rhizobiales bacterium]|nr:hypothetical protein [Hyphomicrobiales bacterium]
MATSDRKPSLGQRTLGIGSNFAAGAMMLSHLNRSALTRYDDLLEDLARLHRDAQGKRADRPLRIRLRPADWHNR